MGIYIIIDQIEEIDQIESPVETVRRNEGIDITLQQISAGKLQTPYS
jgi:hypothetical protein